MGQYEPHDSRNVTRKPGHEPGGIERTGPREAETRRGTPEERKGDKRRGAEVPVGGDASDKA